MTFAKVWKRNTAHRPTHLGDLLLRTQVLANESAATGTLSTPRVGQQWPVSHWQWIFATAVILILLGGGTKAFAYGVNVCAGERFGADLVCTAGDVSITGIAVAPGTPTSCVGGTTFLADLDITVNFSTPDRWDIGIFLANDGNDPQLLTASGGAATCSVGILPTTRPFLDLDPNGGLDTCGDGNGAINGGTGSGVVRLTGVPVSCQAINFSGGNLYIPFVVSWDNQSSPSGANCTSIADPVPNTKSKCNAPKTSLATEVQYGTVNAVILPAITKTDGVSAVNPGDNVSYSVVITNTTGQPLSNAVFTDPATANLTVNSVSCSAAGGATCPAISVAAMQGAGVVIPPMPVNASVTFTLNATVANPVSPAHAHQVVNTAVVTVRGETNSASDIDSINGASYADLTTSTKSVVDRNGGEADPGDVLRYTITLAETAGLAVNGVTVTDNIPAYVNSFTVVSIPAGATNGSTGPGTGSNGTGYLNVAGINLPANGTVTLVFDVTISAGTPAGTLINNTAVVNNPLGPGSTPKAPTITVSPSAVPVTDNKKLYLYGSSPYTMSRNRPAGVPATNAVVVPQGGSITWNGNNPNGLRLDNRVDDAYATLFLSAASSNTRQVQVRLYCSATPTAYTSTPGAYSLSIPATPTQFTFNLTQRNGGFTFPATCTAPNHWVVQVDNQSVGSSRDLSMHPFSAPDYSRLNLDSSNVIYVESLQFYNAAYPGGVPVASATPGTTIYIRTVVSDPFGSFDISAATVDITNPGGTPVVIAAAMTQVNDSGNATKTYEYAYTVPAGATSGNWTVKAIAKEGSEGTVDDDQTAAFSVVVPPPNLSFLKFAQVERDPVNGTTAPKAIPGADVLYSLQVSNSGAGTVDNNTLVFFDPIPANTRLFVNDLGQGSPVLFADSDSDSGFTPPQPFSLSYYSDAACSVVTALSPDANGFDANIRCLQINMTGTMSGAIGAITPDFTLTFRVRIE